MVAVAAVVGVAAEEEVEVDLGVVEEEAGEAVAEVHTLKTNATSVEEEVTLPETVPCTQKEAEGTGAGNAFIVYVSQYLD